MTFNSLLFSKAIQGRILQYGLSLRESAQQTGVSASTLSRLANGESPDIDSFAALVRWLDIDANVFLDTAPDGKMDDAWTRLYLSLQELAVPAELIEAMVKILRLIRK